MKKVLIAAKYTGIGNQVQFIPVIEYILSRGDIVYTDSPVLREIYGGLLYDDYGFYGTYDITYIPFGYNWKKVFKTLRSINTKQVYGYKYRILGRHCGYGYTLSHIFNPDDSELYQNIKNFGGVYDYPRFFVNGVEKIRTPNTVIIHNTEKHEKSIPEEVLATFAKLISLDGYTPIVIGAVPFSYALGEYYKETSSFQSLIDTVKHAEYYVGGDTGVMHLADLYNLKSLVYFGATNSVKNGAINGINIQSTLQCSPCYNWGRVDCTNSWKYKCMKDIKAAEMYHDFINYESHFMLKNNIS
jgi:hypothetical protein